MGDGTSCKALIVPRTASGKSSHTSDDNAAENKSNSERVNDQLLCGLFYTNL